MSLQTEAIAAAERVADGAVAAVIDAIRSEIKDRRDNAFWWNRFHGARYHGLRRIRWIARLHHARMCNRYADMVMADRALGRVCGGAVVRV